MVTVTAGKHKGKTGYCDDEEDGHLIVYFGSWDDGYFLVRAGDCSEADDVARQKYVSEFMSSPERWYSKSPQA